MVGPEKGNHQASTNYLKLHMEAVVESEAWTTAVQINEQHNFQPWLGQN